MAWQALALKGIDAATKAAQDNGAPSTPMVLQSRVDAQPVNTISPNAYIAPAFAPFNVGGLAGAGASAGGSSNSLMWIAIGGLALWLLMRS